MKLYLHILQPSALSNTCKVLRDVESESLQHLVSHVFPSMTLRSAFACNAAGTPNTHKPIPHERPVCLVLKHMDDVFVCLEEQKQSARQETAAQIPPKTTQASPTSSSSVAPLMARAAAAMAASNYRLAAELYEKVSGCVCVCWGVI